MDDFLSRSITVVFGGRDRDRGSGGDWAGQDIGAAVESGVEFGVCLFGLVQRRESRRDEKKPIPPRCCAIMSPCRWGLLLCAPCANW